MCRQKALTLIPEIAEESEFNDTTYNSTYVSDVQSLIKKALYNNFWTKIFDTR